MTRKHDARFLWMANKLVAKWRISVAGVICWFWSDFWLVQVRCFVHTLALLRSVHFAFGRVFDTGKAENVGGSMA